MTQKKICMIGSFGVGKTSLVRRFVDSIFSDHYQTTVAVTIDRKQVNTSKGPANLILWDLAGHSPLTPLRMSYLRGAAGLLVVVDITRNESLQEACGIIQRLPKELIDVPKIFLLNKSDLAAEYELDPSLLKSATENMQAIRTSAKKGDGVEQSFHEMAEKTLSA